MAWLDRAQGQGHKPRTHPCSFPPPLPPHLSGADIGPGRAPGQRVPSCGAAAPGVSAHRGPSGPPPPSRSWGADCPPHPGTWPAQKPAEVSEAPPRVESLGTTSRGWGQPTHGSAQGGLGPHTRISPTVQGRRPWGRWAPGKASERLGVGGRQALCGGLSLAVSLVGPRDPRQLLAQTQQRPGGWAVVPVPLSSQDQSGPSEPGRPSSFLWLGELSLGELWPNPGREGSPRHCVWATRILGEVKGRRGAGRDTAWGNLPGLTRYGGGVPALLQPQVGAASCSITSQGLPSAAGRPRPFLSQLREGQGIARGVPEGRAGAQSPGALLTVGPPQAPPACPATLRGAPGPDRREAQRGIMTQAELGSDWTSGVPLGVWAGHALHREPQTSWDDAAATPGTGGQRVAWAEEGAGQASQRRPQEAEPCAGAGRGGGEGLCWGQGG